MSVFDMVGHFSEWPFLWSEYQACLSGASALMNKRANKPGHALRCRFAFRG